MTRHLAILIATLSLIGCAHVSQTETRELIAAGGDAVADAYVEIMGQCPAVVTHFNDGTVNLQVWNGKTWLGYDYPSIDKAPAWCKDIPR